MSEKNAVADAPSQFHVYYRITADTVAVNGLRTGERFSPLGPHPVPRRAPRK